MDALDELMDRGTQPVAEPDTLDSAMDNYIGGQVGAVRAGATLAADSNPDEIARQKRIATSLGVPLSAVEADPAFATREQKMRQIEAATAQSPALRQKFTNEDFAKLAHDNVDNLSAIEQLWRSAKRGWTAGLRGLDAGAVDDSARILSAIDTIERDGALSPVDPLASMFSGVGSSPENLKQMRAKHQGRLAANAVEFTRRTTGLSKLQPTGATADFYAAKGWADSFSALLSDPFEISANIATESLGIMAPGMPLIAAGGVAGGARGLAGMVGATSTSAEYSSAIAEALQASGVDMNDIEAVKAAAASPEFADVRRKAAIKAVVVGAFDAATAGLAGVKLRPSMAGNLAAQTGVQSAGGAAGEAFGSIASGQEVNASSVLAEAIGEIPGAVFDVATMAGRHALNGQRKADEAEQGAAFIDNINKLAAADKLLQRSPEDFQSFVAAAAEDGPVDTVYIDGKTLMQSGMAPKLVEMSPAVRDQLDRAIITGGQIAIPVDEYAARIAPSELAPQLLDHLKTEPDGFSRTEAADWMANSGSEFQSEVERILTDRQDADTFRASQDVVKQDILGQLNTAGRFTPQVNEAYATLASAYSAVRAAQLGMTPEAFHQQRGMRVQGAVEKADVMDPSVFSQYTGEQFYEGMVRDGVTFDGMTRSAAQEKASRYLNSLGISGIKYLDGASRNRPLREIKREFLAELPEDADFAEVSDLIGTGTFSPANEAVIKALQADDWLGFDYPAQALSAALGDKLAGFDASKALKDAVEAAQDGSTYNYVIFDENAVQILQTYYQPAGGTTTPRGGFSPATNTVTLLKNADLSTFLHESAHYFFESDIQLASELLGKESLAPGEQQIVDDVSSLLTWHGIHGDVTEQLRQWHTMDFEEQRSHHERTAESFEAYLFSGKAPSLELQPVFQRFAAWMVNVYKSIKDFLTRNPEAGKLNDEVRSVFDRMIATREEIALAEQARSMMPLFASPEQSGMTPEDYAKYQAQGVDATNEAIQELQAKGLRDMQWLANARGRAVKKLQKESKAVRAEVTMEARREVMSQPVYQAWEFLTGKADGRTEAQLAYDEARAAWNADRADHEQKTRENLKAALLAANPEVKGLKKGQLLAKNKRQMNIDTDQALLEWDAQHPKPEAPPALSEGETAGGNPFGRLDLAGLAAIGAPDEVVNVLKARKMTAKEGMHPDLVATMFEGFSSGDELVRKLAAAQPPKEAITALADRLMLENHGELSTPEAIELAADAAIHNDARARFVATEYNALAQATGQRKILTAAAKEYAAAMIARLKVRDIRPSQYANAEVRAAKASAKASQSGDLATAAAEKRNQVINTYATRAAYDAQDEVKAGLDYIRRRVTSATSQKNMRGEARAQLLALLDRFDLRKSVSLKELDRQQSLVDWAASEADRLAAPPPILSPEAADEGKRTHYKNLTVEEFRGLMDSVKQLEHLARREQKAYIAIRNMTLQEEVANAVAEIREAWPAAFDADGKAKIATPLTHRYAKTFGDKLTEGLRHLNAEFVPMEELVGQLTAGKFGLLSESLFGRISSASDRKSIMAGEIRDRLAPAYAAYTFQEKRDFSRKVVGDTGMTRENLLMLALYYGNVEGRQRLASQGFSDQVVLARLSNLTEKDLNLAEAIWSLNDGYIWPQYAALNERTQGKAPAKVQALPIQIGARTVKGGYVKLVYDSQFDEKTRRRDSMDDAMAMIGGRANQSAKTNQSSSNERIQELAKMPLLELRAMSQAVNEHMHDIAYREAIADTVRVLRETDMANAIKAVAGKEIYTELLAKVNEVAARPAEPTSMVLKGLNLARKNTVVVLMSGIKTALINYSGLVPALFDNRINAGALVKNIAKVHSPRMREMLAFVIEKSIYMRERNQQFTSDLQHEMASLTVKNRLIPEMGTFLILMRMVDQITSTSVWLAAYEEGKKTFPNDDARAVEYANSVVRSTQAGGRDVDTSKIMTRFGAWSKPFLMFYSFFNRQLGLLVRNGVISRQTWERGNKAKAVGQFTAAYIGIVVIPALINDMASGRCDDAFETGDGWGKCISKAIAMNMAGFVPVVRDLAPYAWGMLDDSEPNFGLRSTALTAYFEGIIKGAASTVDVVNDEGDERDTKSIFMGLAFLFGLPGKLLWDTMAGTEAVINEDAPPQSMLFGPPKN